jgi:hypothetical protein
VAQRRTGLASPVTTSAYPGAMTPIADAHVCTPPATADLYGREIDFEYACGPHGVCDEHYWSESGNLTEWPQTSSISRTV